jgi:putative FmdB family regulatory protein
LPLYEYECDSCSRRTEVIQRVGAPPIGPCEECGGEMKRLLSAPAFQFKGTGWYVTDYAKKSGPGSSSSGSEETKRDKTESKSSETPKKKESSDSSSKKSD